MSLPPGTVVDRYRVEALVGRGGAGSVYRVRHVSLDLLRALKVVHLGVPELRERLIEEGRIQARLSHPHLVKVHDAFEVQGDPALLMELIEGPSLAQVLESTRLSLEQAERLYLEVLDGVAHAHAHGVIHRDLKPANVLLATQGGRTLAKVGDFGISRLIDEERTGATGPTGWLGTPEYMAPEQLRGVGARDVRVDVYALGVLLYRLLAHEHPFPEPHPLRRLADAEQCRWRPLAEVRPDLPARFVQAVEGALAPEPEGRIPDLAVLRSVLLGERPWPGEVPVTPATGRSLEAGRAPEEAETAGVGGPGSGPMRAPGGTLGRRSGPWLVAAGLGLLALVAGAAALHGQRAAAELSADLDALDARLAARELALASAREGRPTAALALARAAATLDGETALSPHLAASLLARGAAARVLQDRGQPLTGAALGPSRALFVDHDGRLEVRSRATGVLERVLETGVFRARWLHFAADESWVLAEGGVSRGEAGRPVLAWGVDDGRPRVPAPAPAKSMAADTEAGVVVAVYPDLGGVTALTAWSSETGKRLWSRPFEEVRMVRLAVGAGLLALPHGAGRYAMLDLASGAALPGLEDLEGHVMSLASSGTAAAARIGVDGVRVLELPTGRVLLDADGAPEAMGRLDATGTAFAVHDLFGKVRWWPDLSGPAEIVDLPGRGSTLDLPDPDGLVVGTREGRLVRVRAGRIRSASWLHHGRVTDVVSLEDVTLSVALDGSAVLQPEPHGLLGMEEELLASPRALGSWGGPGGLAWAEEESGRALVAGGAAGERRVVELPGRPRLARVDGDGCVVVQGNTRITVSCEEGESQRLDLPARLANVRPLGIHRMGELVAVSSWSGVALLQPGRAPREVTVSRLAHTRAGPEGRELFVAFGKEATVAVVDVATSTWDRTLSMESPMPPGVAVLSEVSEGFLWAGTWDGAVLGWDVRTGAARVLGELEDAVHRLAVAPGRLATAGWDDRVRVWDLATGAVRWEVEVPRSPRTLLWLPDGEHLLVGTTAGTLQVYDGSGQLVSVRVVAEESVEETWLRPDGHIAVATAEGRWQRWSAEALLDGHTDLAHLGALTNLRVCRGSTEVVAVVPYPEPEGVWAPPELCGGGLPGTEGESGGI